MIWAIAGVIIGVAIGYFVTRYFIQVQQKRIDDNVYQELQNLQDKKEILAGSINNLETQATQAADVFYKEKLDLARARFALDLEEEEKSFNEAKEKYLKEYNSIIEDYYEALQSQAAKLASSTDDVQQVQSLLEDIKKRIDCAIEVEKKMELERTEKDYYRCVISQIDQDEIEKIRSIEPYLRNKEPLNKIIWSVYYAKPFSDMLGRVIGPETKTGIYKITNLNNGMCYIGQAVDFRKRWTQHIKRGVGAENGGGNKLYEAMKEIGPENFTFEIIEECAPEMLDAREDYWQDFFHAKDFGYSIK